MQYFILGALGILLVAGGAGVYIYKYNQPARTPLSTSTLSTSMENNTHTSAESNTVSPAVAAPSDTPAPAYESVVTFAKGAPIIYPDFTTTFTGTTAVTSEAAPQLTFTHYDFTVTSHDGHTRTLSWSSGTGEIAPKLFVVENQVYALELKFAGKDARPLTETELVISRVETDFFGAKIGVANYLFQLIAQLTPLTTQTYDSIGTVLGFDFTQKPLAALTQNVYESTGFGPITHAELRMSRMNDAKKLLILSIESGAQIQKAEVLTKYPNATASISPHADTTTGLSVPGIFGFGETWGTITFGFDAEETLTSIVINSLD